MVGTQALLAASDDLFEQLFSPLVFTDLTVDLAQICQGPFIVAVARIADTQGGLVGGNGFARLSGPLPLHSAVEQVVKVLGPGGRANHGREKKHAASNAD